MKTSLEIAGRIARTLQAQIGIPDTAAPMAAVIDAEIAPFISTLQRIADGGDDSMTGLSCSMEAMAVLTGSPFTQPLRLAPLDLLGRALEFVEFAGAGLNDQKARELAQSIREALHTATLARGETLTLPEGEAINAQMLATLRNLWEWNAQQGYSEALPWGAARELLDRVADAERAAIDQPVAPVSSAPKGNAVRDQLVAAMHDLASAFGNLWATQFPKGAPQNDTLDAAYAAIAAAERERLDGHACPVSTGRKWWAVACRVSDAGKPIETGTVYVLAANEIDARSIAVSHVYDTWASTQDVGAPSAASVFVNSDAPQPQDDTDPRFNRPESVFTDDGRTHPGT